MSFTDLRAFEVLLGNRASEAEIDQFLDGLNSRHDEDSEMLLKHFSKSTGAIRGQLPFLSELYANGIYIDRRPESRIVFIFFSSILDCMGTAGVRSRLQQMKANCIYLHDDRFLNFGLGVKQLGSDGLVRCIHTLDARRIITVGSSAAGFAAIKRGLSLNAYACVTFSPFTTFADEHRRQDTRGKAVVERCRLLAPDMLIDLVPLLAKQDPALKLVCFYSKRLPLDAWHAERVQSVCNTFMMPTSLETHASLGPLIFTGLFDVFMQPLADGMSVEASVADCKARYTAPSPAAARLVNRPGS